MKRLIVIVLVLVGIWLLGDFVYSRLVFSHYRAWESGIVRDERGVRIGCEARDVGQGESAILLVHGFNDSPHAFHKMIDQLAEAGYHCRAMRMPGFGMPLEDYMRTNRTQWVEAVRAEAARLRGEHDEVYIVAHSLGGAVTIACLLDDPELADKVALLAPAVEVSSRRSPVLDTRAWHRVGNRLLYFTTVTQTPFDNDAHDPDERKYPMRIPFSPRSVIDNTLALMTEIQGRGSDFKTPMLMVLTKDDQIVDWEVALRFYDDAASTDKELYYAENSGHAIPVDYDWKEVTERILEFFQPTEGE